MKSLAAILTTAMLLQEPEKVELAWNPPPGRIIAVSLSLTKTSGTSAATELKAEAELHPLATEVERRTPSGESEPLPPKGKADVGRAFLLKGLRYSLQYFDAQHKGGFLYQRGKDPVTQGQGDYYNSGTVSRMGDDHKFWITDRGLRSWTRGFVEPFDPVSTGSLEFLLPPIPVKKGINWITATDLTPNDLAGPGFSFKGKVKFTVKSLDRGRTARIDIVAVPDDFFEDGNTYAGSGELTYSFEDRLISSSTFAMTQTNKEGKVLATFRQVLTQKLKP